MRIMQSKKGDLGASEGEWAVSACFSGIKKPACGRRYFRYFPRFYWVLAQLIILSPQLSPHPDIACFL